MRRLLGRRLLLLGDETGRGSRGTRLPAVDFKGVGCWVYDDAEVEDRQIDDARRNVIIRW